MQIRAFSYRRSLFGRGFLSGSVILVWLLYLTLGNLSRVGQLSKSGGLPLLEVLLFAIVGLAYLLIRIPLIKHMLLFFPIILTSWLFGLLVNHSLSISNHLPALAYALRLIFLLLAANAVAWLLSRRIQPQQMLRLMQNILLLEVGVGLILYVVFPSSADLWHFLERFGVEFNGDPHQRRLLGPTLDPNFFGNLLILGVLISFGPMVSRSIKMRLNAVIYVLIFVAAIALTVSRSSFLGLALALLLTVIIFGAISFSTRLQVQWVRFMGTLFLSAVVVSGIATMLLPREIARLAGRIATTGSDSSAFERLISATDGLSFLLEPQTLLLGVGYNYIPTVAEGFLIITSFYSSIINTWVAFGIPLSLVLTLLIAASMATFTRNLLYSHPLLFSALWAYLLSSIVMGLFNNLLYYPLYLLTFLPLPLYFYWRDRAQRNF